MPEDRQYRFDLETGDFKPVEPKSVNVDDNQTFTLPALTRSEAKALNLAWGIIAAVRTGMPDAAAFMVLRLVEKYDDQLVSLTAKMTKLQNEAYGHSL